MPATLLFILILLFFVTSVVGVVTGSNSLITVPVMFQFGIDAKVAVATNMFGLTFMSIGGALPFIRKGLIDYRKISPLIILTAISSTLGALLVGLIADQNLKLIVSLAMIAMVVFTFLKRGSEPVSNSLVSRGALILTYILTFRSWHLRRIVQRRLYNCADCGLRFVLWYVVC